MTEAVIKEMSYLSRYFEKNRNGSRGAIAYLAALDYLQESCPLVAEKIVDELRDQRSHVKLIASENYSSIAVQLAMGNLLTDKYAEGFPFHRFYAGCSNVDALEKEAADEAKALFGADHAYVQPHSGADANMVALWAILLHKVQNPAMEKFQGKTLQTLTDAEYEEVRQLVVGQKLMGMGLSSGGHLTHGYRLNVSAKMLHSVCYEVDLETGLLDYAALAEQVKREKPLILLAGYSSYPRRLNFAVLREIADSVGAVLMVDMAHFAGLVAGKVFVGDEDPIPFADIVTSTTHKTLRGPRGGLILCTEEYRAVVDKGCPTVLGGPLPHVIASKVVAFKEAKEDSFRTYAAKIVENSRTLAEELTRRGVELITGGTDNHLLVLDVYGSFGVNGRQAEAALRSAGLTVNRNTIPGDEMGPWYTSGVRIGTPAITTRGMGKEEMREIASVICLVLSSLDPEKHRDKQALLLDEKAMTEARTRIADLLGRFPLYPEIEID